jgi:hypothetical protein
VRFQRRLLLGAVLGLAAVLRFTGLSWGLRHTPYHDERYFVESTAQMVVHGDLDHRFYEYPGLLFYLLLPLLALMGAKVPPGPEAYLVARGLVAAFGVLSVALVYRLGQRLMGERAGLVAALFLAVSPLDVETAHMVRPDVVLQSFVLLAFLAFARVGTSPARDLLSGVALGAASAVKFTGILLAPCYVACRWLAPGPRVRRVALVALVAATVLLLLTPYSVLHYQAFLRGMSYQWSWHYRGEGGTGDFLRLLLFYLRAIVETLGPAGAGLAVAGLVLARTQWRPWLPLVLHLALTLVVSCAADRAWQRFLLPCLGVLVLLVARAMEAVRSALPRAWAAVLAAAALLPLWSSLGYVRYVLEPGAWDRVAAWIDLNLPPGSRIVSALPALGLDRSRFEVVGAPSQPEAARLVARHADVLVVDAEAAQATAAAGFQEAFRAGPTRDDAATVVFLVPAELRPRYQPVQLERGWLSASENEALLPALLDEDPATAWSTDGPQRPGSWVQVDLPQPLLLGRVELGLGNRPERLGRDTHLLITQDGRVWNRIPAYSGRPPLEAQDPGQGERSDAFIIEPSRARGVRLVQMGQGDRRWGFARLRLDALR